jgi:hypothetical protein
VQDRRGAYLQIDVPDPLLGHVELLLASRTALIERRETLDVLGQPSGVVDAMDKVHLVVLPTTSPSR